VPPVVPPSVEVLLPGLAQAARVQAAIAAMPNRRPGREDGEVVTACDLVRG
jgi:hypothetical protein